MREKVKEAVDLFIKNDIDLLESDAHEQAVSHRIGVYLEGAFDSPELKVDCEYNKHLYEPKKINLYDLDPEKCKYCKCDSCKIVIDKNLNEIREKGLRPDVLVHARGNDNSNLIAIEIKKDKECPFDQAKLVALTKSMEDDGEYGYDLGVFIWFVENKPQYKWFEDGKVSE